MSHCRCYSSYKPLRLVPCCLQEVPEALVVHRALKVRIWLQSPSHTHISSHFPINPYIPISLQGLDSLSPHFAGVRPCVL